MSVAVILAGGKSSRMGFDKQTIRIGQKLIAVELADRISSLFDRVMIISNRPELYREECDYEVISDLIESKGPISGIYTGLVSAKDDRDDYVYFVACDMPNINMDYIEYMRSLMSDGSDVISTINDEYVETLNAFYRKSLIPFIERQIEEGRFSLRHIFDENRVHLVERDVLRKFDPSNSMF
ncbi:MAG: molybdenum cofactor guanylyltransferase, partial [Bacillota bacterium]|nr:molybdenum cofactor guanylyltransferase [Bacillota bacterium]